MFQSTHPRRVWLPFAWRCLLVRGFNPHTHEGCDAKYLQPANFVIKFQSTHPRRVWLHNMVMRVLLICFNPHTHEGCDTTTIEHSSDYFSFNPHTHEGCDCKISDSDYVPIVSIHTPTKGVTPLCVFCRVTGMFQSTHPRRVWPTFLGYALMRFLFQSTHPRRVWPTNSSSPLVEAQFQSTHPRRVWLKINYMANKVLGFNPHTHEGCDQLTMINFLLVVCFNPHTHEGCDRCHRSRTGCFNGFNPHTHEGCDLKHLQQIMLLTQFQSTHPRRVWPALNSDAFTRIRVSIHTPTKGVTATALQKYREIQFQSTHPRRVWHDFLRHYQII